MTPLTPPGGWPSPVTTDSPSTPPSSGSTTTPSPIKYAERLGDIPKRFTPPHVILRDTHDGKWVPTDREFEKAMNKAHQNAQRGTYPLYERNKKIWNSGETLTDAHVHEECQEYISKEHKANTPPVDPSLPPLVRGQDTFGYSYIAFAFAATEARAQNFKFRLDDLESVVDVGVDLLAEKAQDYVQSSMSFMDEVDQWTKMNIRKDTMKANDPIWKEHCMFLVLYERTVARLMLWNEMKYLIGRLRALGMDNDGTNVRLQLATNPRMMILWEELWLCAVQAVNFVSHSLRDAYAVSLGAKHVRRVLPKRGKEWPYYDAVEWRMSVEDIVEFNKEDYYEACMAIYCLTTNNIDGMHFMEEKTLGNIVSKQGQFLVEYVMLKEPERASKIPQPMQYLMSEKNITIDLCYTLVAGNGWPSNLVEALAVERPVGSRIGRQTRLSVLRNVMSYYRKTKGDDDVLSGILTGRQPYFDPDRVKEMPIAMPKEIENMVKGLMRFMSTTMLMDKYEKTWAQMLQFSVRKPISSSSGKIDYFSELTISKRTRYRRVADGSEAGGSGSSSSGGGTAFPVSTESHTQSSHQYLKEHGLLKGTGKTSNSVPSPQLLENDERLTDDPSEDDEEEVSYATAAECGDDGQGKTRHQVNRHEWKLVQKLFAKDESKVGQVKWVELNKMIRRIGFRIELRGGSVVSWVPALSVGHPINVHRPHPENSFGPIQCKTLADRLKRKYGWTIETFERKTAITTIEAIEDVHLD